LISTFLAISSASFLSKSAKLSSFPIGLLLNLWPAKFISYNGILFLSENSRKYILSSSGEGVGFSNWIIYGLTNTFNAIGSFNALMRSLNYFNEDNPNKSAA